MRNIAELLKIIVILGDFSNSCPTPFTTAYYALQILKPIINCNQDKT
jgi:hypothetical protein